MGTSVQPQQPQTPALLADPGSDPRAVIRDILTRLGPKAQDFSDQEIAEAARRLVAQRTTTLIPAQPKPSLGENVVAGVKAVGLGIAESIGDMANAVRHGLGGILDVSGFGRRDTPPLSPNAQASVNRGDALMASILVSSAAGPAFKLLPGSVGFQKAIQYLAGDFLGGETYGAVSGQSPKEALQTGAVFGLTGGAIGAGGALTSKLLSGVQHTAVPITRTAATREAAQTADALAAEHLDALRTVPEEALSPTPRLSESAAAPGVMEAHAARIMAADGVTTRKLAQLNEAVNLAVAHTPSGDLATPAIRQEAGRLALEQSHPLTFDEIATRHLASGDDRAFVQALVDHNHIEPHALNFDGIKAPTPGPKPLLPSLDIAPVLAQMPTEQLSKLARAAKAGLGEAGFVASRRLLTGGLGVGLGVSGQVAEAQGMPEPGPSLLKAAAGLLVAEAGVTSPGLRTLFGESWQFSRRVLQSLDARPWLKSPGAPEAADAIRNMVNRNEAWVGMFERRLGAVFNTPESRNAMRYVAEKGEASPYYASLTPAQRDAVTQIMANNAALGRVAVERGVMGNQLEDYFARILKPTARAALERRFGGLQAAVGAFQTSGGFAKERVFFGTGQLETWLRRYGLEDALEKDGVVASAAHYRAVFKALANKSMKDAMTEMGHLRPLEAAPGNLPASKFVDPPPGWRELDPRIWPLRGQMAPTDVAALLENMSKVSPMPGLMKTGYDVLNSVATKMILYNRYIHGINLWRARNFNVWVGHDAYANALEAVRTGDESLMQWPALVGGGRPHYGSAIQQGLDAMVERLGANHIASKALGAMNRWAVSNEQKLFGEMVPATGIAVAETEMRRWSEQTKFAFGPGSPEWQAAHDRIERFALNQMGRVPTLYRSAEMQQGLRRLFLAPQWFETRWNLAAGALRDVSQIGSVPLGDMLYAKAKMRALVSIAAGGTALSLILSGKPPEFNPNTGKFYILTGLKDARGRDVGIDPFAWSQADLQMFGRPTNYVMGRLAPAVQIAGTALSGRDRLTGKQLSAPEAVENLAQHFGGLVGGAESVVRTATSGQLPTAGEAVKTVASTTGLAGASSLPNLENVTLAARARKLLTQADVPPSNDRIWELTKAIRADIRREGGYGRYTQLYLANERRTFAARSPTAAALYPLWRYLTGVLPSWVQ